MVAYNIQFGRGITVGQGNSIGVSSGTPGLDNVTGYAEMPGPITSGAGSFTNLQDPTATINDPVGFTINDDQLTGIAITNLSASNQAFFATYGTGLKTVTWGAGSTVAYSTVDITQNSGAFLVFQIVGQTGAATYNYPFTFS